LSYGRSVRTVISPGGVFPGLMFEQIQHEDTIQYAVKNLKTGMIRPQPFISPSEHVTYRPLTPSPWILPPMAKIYGSPDDLWKDMREFVYDHLDLEKEIMYDIFVAWVLHTWTPERWDSVGYLWLNGPTNSGKTRAMDLLNYLAFRSLLSPSVSAASIYRALDAFHPTFLLDEFEMYQKQKELKAEVIGVLNAGYRRGQVVLRTDKIRDGAPVLRGFDVFGPKAIASIQMLPNALQGRTIKFVMSRAVRKVKRIINKEWAAELRGKLLQYRFDYALEPPPSGNPVELPEGRLVEIYLPLITVAPRTDIVEGFIEYATGEYRSRVEEELDTNEAKVYNAIIDLLMENPRWRIPQADIREKVNARLSEKEQLSKVKVGYVLKRLGLESETNRETRLKEIIIDLNALERRKIRYVIPESIKEVDELFDKMRKGAVVQTTFSVIEKLPTPFLGVCELCGETGTIAYKVKIEGKTRHICEKCFQEMNWK